MEEKIQQKIILCKKCYKEGENNIPSIHMSEKSWEIKFTCPKNHDINSDIIKMNLDDNLKSLLGVCQQHKEVFCAWSEKEGKN